MPESLSSPNHENRDNGAINYQSALDKAQDGVDSEPRPHTPDQIARLGFDSFRFSQGGAGLQGEIIDYLVGKHPERFPTDAVAESLAATEKMAASFVHRGAAHEQKDSANLDLSKELQRLARQWGAALSRDDANRSSSLKYLTDMVTEHALAFDYYYLVERNGRPRAAESDDSVSRPNSKYLSQLVYYGLTGHDTHAEPFAEMFQDMVANATADPDRTITLMSDDESNPFSTMPLSDVLQAVAAVHFEHYPADADDLPPEWQKLRQDNNHAA